MRGVHEPISHLKPCELSCLDGDYFQYRSINPNVLYSQLQELITEQVTTLLPVSLLLLVSPLLPVAPLLLISPLLPIAALLPVSPLLRPHSLECRPSLCPGF